LNGSKASLWGRDMNRILKACSVVAITVSAGALAHAAAPSEFRFWNPMELKFTETAKGVERATAWGDPAKGDYGMIVKYRAGAQRGWHTHSSPIHLVMIAGTLVFESEGAAPLEMGPGSGVTEVANVKHTSRCKEGADCMFIITGSRPYDLKLATSPIPAD